MLLGESAFCETTISDEPGPLLARGAIAVELLTQIAIVADLNVDQAVTVQLVIQPDQ